MHLFNEDVSNNTNSICYDDKCYNADKATFEKNNGKNQLCFNNNYFDRTCYDIYPEGEAGNSGNGGNTDAGNQGGNENQGSGGNQGGTTSGDGGDN